MSIRAVENITFAVAKLEGAGVRLHRAFGNPDTPQFDPFLLLDDFRGDTPADFIKGFPWHPHRGIETVTYMLEGSVEHGDSMGNSGVISAGDVQWMTAGSGIIHQEMPAGNDSGRMGGFQLWVNLPAQNKMIPPRYREVKSTEIKTVSLDNGVVVRVIAGEFNGERGPVTEIIRNPSFFDISIPAGVEFQHAVSSDHNVIAYVFEGEAFFGSNELVGSNRNLVHFSRGDRVSVVTKNAAVRFILLVGEPLNEPIAWYGPIVMNTREELDAAIREYNDGTFIKK